MNEKGVLRFRRTPVKFFEYNRLRVNGNVQVLDLENILGRFRRWGVWNGFPELGHARFPVGEKVPCVRTVSRGSVRFDNLFQGVHFGALAETFDADHRWIVKVGEGFVFVVNECETTAHSSAEIGAGLAKRNHQAASHVLASMVAQAFHHGNCPAIAYAEAFACATCCEKVTAGSAVQASIAYDDVVLPNVAFLFLRTDDDFATAHSLAHIVIGFSEELHANAGREECAEALSGRTDEFEIDRRRRQVIAASDVSDFSGEVRT
jgi:hypothetical protein